MVIAVILTTVAGCGDSFGVLSASLGGDTAGERGLIRIVFLNNTPHRVVFTTGTYDSLDDVSVPTYSQFGLEDDGLTLPGYSETIIGSLTCARLFSIGSDRLLELIQTNDPDAELVPEASEPGVTFYREDDTDADGEPIVEGTIGPFEARLGVDFPCGALLIVQFEINDVGDEPFRIFYQIVPAESSR